MRFHWLFIFFFSCLPCLLQSQQSAPNFQTGHYSKVKELLFHPDNQHLISCADDGKIVVWDIHLGLQRTEVLAHKNGLKEIGFLNDSVLISLGTHNDLKMWSLPNLSPINQLIINSDSIQAFAVIDSHRLCVVGRNVHFYDLLNNRLTSTNYKSKGLFNSVDYRKSNNEVVVTGPKDNYAVTINIIEPLLFHHYFVGNIHKAIYSDDLLLMATTKGALIYYNHANAKKHIFNLNDDLNYVTDMAAKKGTIAIGTAFGFTNVLEVKTNKIRTSIGMNGIAISALNYSDDSKWLALANTKGVIYLYDTENYKLNNILKGGAASILDLQVFDDEVIIGYSDGVIRYMNFPNNQLKSNSIKLDEIQEQNGENYSILSIDSMEVETVYFTVLKTNRHHIKSSLLKKAEKMKGIWNLSKNEITLSQKIRDPALNGLVNKNFKEQKAFVFEDYHDQHTKYHFHGESYSLDSNEYSFMNDQNKLKYPTKHSAPITGLRYLSNYEIILSFSQDGSIRFWDKLGEYVAVLYLAGQYSFFYLNKDNFYFASKEILENIGFVNNGKLYGYEQYDLYYNRPNEVMEDLHFFDSTEISDHKKAYLKRLDKLGVLVNELNVSDKLPEMLVDYNGDYSTKKDSINFSLSMRDADGDIIAYSYLINGIEKQFTLKHPRSNYKTELNLILSAGINQIEFYCVNDKGIRSLRKKKIITCEKNFDKPNLYILSIGVSEYLNPDFNLKFAQKDAQEIASLLSKGKPYDRVFSMELYNADFTLDKKSSIANFLHQATINDVILFYYAGHGVLDEEFNYYLATHNMDFNAPNDLGLPFDELEQLFEKMECRNKLMMIDACFSGEIDKTSIKVDTNRIERQDEIQFRSTQAAAIDGYGDMGIFELSKLLFADLRVSKGTNILSSSSGIEYALEGDKWGNGLFTYVLKNALLKTEADLNDDKQIRVMELQVYLRETVSALSDGNQNPILRKENIKNNFVLW
ncbi:caspase family protein [Crocinitomix catalasitica]|uniref:caspase family protein n=1 Tax=Crocinitomix catalasitica TaxID=184607 RepID=UPI0004800A48|nr:caspase family protein [Crocinitomix catalasitica]